MNTTLLQIDLLGIPKLRSGKVREMFDLGDSLLMVATDRISAFDVVMPNGIPRKGETLTKLSHFWFNLSKSQIPNHLISTSLPAKVNDIRLKNRCMVVKKAKPLPIECVARGYLAGSGWKEYREHGTLAGRLLPKGLSESSPLPEPAFTPATKAETGHDINITEEEAAKLVGEGIFKAAKEYTLSLYSFAAEYARKRGVIIADTKFEFGLYEGDLILIDEVLTPDSSRFWPAATYEPGRPQPSFDKQFLRDYLETLDWNKQPPGPELPTEVVAKTTEKYLEAFRLLTGADMA